MMGFEDKLRSWEAARGQRQPEGHRGAREHHDQSLALFERLAVEPRMRAVRQSLERTYGSTPASAIARNVKVWSKYVACAGAWEETEIRPLGGGVEAHVPSGDV